jgi:hypothetical protein
MCSGCWTRWRRHCWRWPTRNVSGGVIDAGVSAAAQSLPAKRQRRRGCTLKSTARPTRAGESSFIGETLTRLGVRNIVPAALGPFPKLNPEFVVRANPDVIMVGDRNFAGMEGPPGLGRHAAPYAQRAGVRVQARAIRHAGAPRPAHGRGARIMASVCRTNSLRRHSRDCTATTLHAKACHARHRRTAVLAARWCWRAGGCCCGQPGSCSTGSSAIFRGQHRL